MKVEIKVPSMGESILEATVASLLKKTGDKVSLDEELLELETDKVNQVLYASQSGTIQWVVSKDSVVKIGQVIGYIDSEQIKEETGAVETEVPAFKPLPMTKIEGARILKEEFFANTPILTQKETDVPKQRIIEVKEPVQVGQETRVKMTKIRRLIADRLVNVMQHTAMLTTFNEVDMTAIINLRAQYKKDFEEQHHVRLGFMSFFVKAVVFALKSFPEVNAYIDGDEIVYRNYFNIGIAVGTEKGLIVPVVRGCDHLSFAEIESSIESYATKARSGKLSADDLQGGGFTITNGGVYGSMLSTPILNPPQSAILGMHNIMKRPVVVNDEIVIRQMMYLALSYDHRMIDGKEAVSFLVHVKKHLEDPSKIFLDVN